MTCEKVHEINRAYFNRLADWLDRDRIFTRADTDTSEGRQKLYAQCRDESGLRVRSLLGDITSLQYKCLRIAIEAHAFWFEQRESYMAAVRGLPGMCAYVSGEDSSQHRLLYFDAVVINDPMFAALPTTDPGLLAFEVICGLQRLRDLRQLVEADV